MIKNLDNINRKIKYCCNNGVLLTNIELEELQDIKQDLEELEILRQSVKDTYDTGQEIIFDLKEENQKLKDELAEYTAPKSIKLSELIKKLNILSPNIKREGKFTRVYSCRALILNIIEGHIQPINVQPYSGTKWLFKLWIDDVIVEDDLEEE